MTEAERVEGERLKRLQRRPWFGKRWFVGVTSEGKIERGWPDDAPTGQITSDPKGEVIKVMATGEAASQLHEAQRQVAEAEQAMNLAIMARTDAEAERDEAQRRAEKYESKWQTAMNRQKDGILAVSRVVELKHQVEKLRKALEYIAADENWTDSTIDAGAGNPPLIYGHDSIRELARSALQPDSSKEKP